MIIFDVDVPLVEVIFALAIVGVLILLEIIIVVILLMRNLKKTKEIMDMLREEAYSREPSVKKAQPEISVKKGPPLKIVQ